MAETRLIVSAAPLAPGFQGDLNKWFRAMIDRIHVTSPFGPVQIQIGGLEPTTNVGIWWKFGTQPHVWDDVQKKYVPEDVTASLTNYYNKAEVDAILADDLAAFSSQFAALSASVVQKNSARAESLGSMTLPIDNTFYKVTNLATEAFDLGNAFDPGLSQYVVPITGIYHVSVTSQFDNDGGNAADMQVSLFVSRDGANALGSTDAKVSPPGSRWFITLSGDCAFNAGQVIDLRVSATDGVLAGNLQVGNIMFSIHLVQTV